MSLLSSDCHCLLTPVCAKRSFRPWRYKDEPDTLPALEPQQSSVETGGSEILMKHFAAHLSYCEVSFLKAGHMSF